MKETVKVEETLEQKVERLESENKKLMAVAQEHAKRAYEAEKTLASISRLKMLLEIINGKATYPALWIKMVKAEVMYRVNGYDPDGMFSPTEKTGADSDIEVKEGDEIEEV